GWSGHDYLWTGLDYGYERRNYFRRGNDRLHGGNPFPQGGYDHFRLPHEFLGGSNKYLGRRENGRRGAGGSVPKNRLPGYLPDKWTRFLKIMATKKAQKDTRKPFCDFVPLCCYSLSTEHGSQQEIEPV